MDDDRTCFDVGMGGGCGYSCPVFLCGDCEKDIGAEAVARYIEDGEEEWTEEDLQELCKAYDVPYPGEEPQVVQEQEILWDSIKDLCK